MTTIPVSLSQTVSHPEAPWRPSPNIVKRIEQKPEEANAFKLCLLLKGDPELEFAKQYFFANKPAGLGIRAVYYIDNPGATQVFEGTLRGTEVDANKPIFKPNWPNEPQASDRGKAANRWKSMANLFGPFKLGDNESAITSAKALPLWHGSNAVKCGSIASGGFTYFGKHHFFNPNAQKGTAPSIDQGYFGSGIYFTDSAQYASYARTLFCHQ